jgi:F-type H+-transporting ATPase subunit epsilon
MATSAETNTLQIDVVSPEGAVYSGKAAMVFIKGQEGELGIKPGHAQLLTKVAPGSMRIQHADGKEDVLFVAGGILEIQPNHISVLADTVVRPQDINEQSAQEAIANAKKALLGKPETLTAEQLRYQLAESTAKLELLKMLRQKRLHL